MHHQRRAEGVRPGSLAPPSSLKANLLQLRSSKVPRSEYWRGMSAFTFERITDRRADSHGQRQYLKGAERCRSTPSAQVCPRAQMGSHRDVSQQVHLARQKSESRSGTARHLRRTHHPCRLATTLAWIVSPERPQHQGGAGMEESRHSRKKVDTLGSL